MFGREECLEIGDGKEDARLVECGQLLVQLGVEEGERALGLLQLLPGATNLDLLALLRILQRLEAVALAVVVDQFAAAFLNLFL